MMSHGELTGHAWISRFSRLAEDAETADCGFVMRKVFLTVESKQKQFASGELNVWRGVYRDDVSFGLDTFVERGDRSSQSEYEMAHAVATIWGGKDPETWWLEQSPFCFGDLCIFERLAIDSRSVSHTYGTWTIINSLLERLCLRDTAAIVLKAFPLEYEGNVTKGNLTAFERRRRALVRLYKFRLGLKLVPDTGLAYEGWMLKLINTGAEPEKRC
jgi:hypothetical protein